MRKGEASMINNLILKLLEKKTCGKGCFTVKRTKTERSSFVSLILTKDESYEKLITDAIRSSRIWEENNKTEVSNCKVQFIRKVYSRR